MKTFMEKPAAREGELIPVETFQAERWRISIGQGQSALRVPGNTRVIHLPGAVSTTSEQNLSAVLSAVLQKLAA